MNEDANNAGFLISPISWAEKQSKNRHLKPFCNIAKENTIRAAAFVANTTQNQNKRKRRQCEYTSVTREITTLVTARRKHKHVRHLRSQICRHVLVLPPVRVAVGVVFILKPLGLTTYCNVWISRWISATSVPDRTSPRICSSTKSLDYLHHGCTQSELEQRPSGLHSHKMRTCLTRKQSMLHSIF